MYKLRLTLYPVISKQFKKEVQKAELWRHVWRRGDGMTSDFYSNKYCKGDLWEFKLKWKLIWLGIESTFLLMIYWILTAAMLIDVLHKEQQHVLTLKWWSCNSKKDLFNSSSFYLFFFPKSSKEFGSAFELSKETTKIKTNSYQKRTDNNKNKN